ncbi:MAG: GPR1/FUN34/YaaH family transporter [Deltaproteobacteria bacterium]|nr:GPR1/FUN34/YaaH family transporter [Deltaproteobacteria bacterium]
MQSSQPSAASPPVPVFAEPTPLGLLGLAVGCAALLPIAFGQALTPAAFRTAAMYCLLFGGGCQFLAGMMALVNKNLLGGTLFTTFAFNWVINWHVLSGLSEGRLPDPTVALSIDLCFAVIFVVLTFAFGFYSKLLFAFLLDIDVLFGCRIAKELTHSAAFAMPIALATVLLGLIALYLAFAILLNTAAGRTILTIPGPLFSPTLPESVPPSGDSTHT